VPKMHRNPKSTSLRNELFLVPFGIPGIWYSLWWMLCMVWHVLLCNGIISQKRNGKEEGKFWGTTAAPIQSSSSLEARWLMPFERQGMRWLNTKTDPEIYTLNPKSCIKR
jgi:hypothetical protein